MAQVEVNWPSGLGFGRLLTGITLPEAVGAVFDTARVDRVEVVPEHGLWRILFTTNREIEQLHLDTVAAHIRQQVPGLKTVELVPSFALFAISSPEDLERQWPEVAELAGRKVPVLQEWLRRASVRLEGEHLTLVVEGELGRQLVLAQKGDRLVAAIVSELFGRALTVAVDAVDPEPAESREVLDREEEKYLRSFAERRTALAEKAARSHQVLIGREISGSVTPLSGVVEEERSVTVAGRVFNSKLRELKSGRRVLTFDITDETDSISAKVFLGESDQVVDLPDGTWVISRGPVQEDKFTQELTLMVADLVVGQPPSREDNCADKRVELHLHTRMSSLDGVSSVTDVVRQAARWGHSAVAITDHGVVQAFPEAYEAGRKHGIKIICGVEAYLFDDDQKERRDAPTYHCTILARNQEGLKRLYELVSLSHLQHFYRHPRIPRSELAARREDLLIGSACEAGELIRAYLDGRSRDELLKMAGFYDYLEIQPVGNNEFLVRDGRLAGVADLEEMNKNIISIGKELGKPVVAAGDVHFLHPSDEVYRRIILHGKGFLDAQNQAPLFLRTTEEMLAEFSYLDPGLAREVVVENPTLIAAMVDSVRPVPEEFFPPYIEGAESLVEDLTWGRAREIYGDPLPDIVRARIEKELASIIGNGFAVLYAIALKLVKKSNGDGYLVGSRGSVGSSVVAYLCGITEVNPLPPHYICSHGHYSDFSSGTQHGSGADMPALACPQCGRPLHKDGHDIPFETFLGFEGDKVPDIDLNFSGEYQSRAHRYVEELFGRDYVFRAGTIATIAERTAFGFVKNFLEEQGRVPRNAEVLRLVAGCTGVKRTTGQHPGGMMILPQTMDIHEFTPVQRPADDTDSEVITTHFDYEAISSRLVKLDILGHDDPTVLKMLQDLTGVDVKSVPLDDAATMQLFAGVEPLGVKPERIGSQIGTIGIPEFGTRFVRQILEDTRPKTFSDLVRISGFSHGTDVWLNNAQELIRSGTAKLAEAISTRDDIMIQLIKWNLPPKRAFAIMESVRKGKGLKPVDVEEMKQAGVPGWYIDSCRKIKYMFPKAHAVAYVTMAFRIAYFKVHHPAPFYASFFTVRADEFDADLICRGPENVRAKIMEIEKKGNEAPIKEKNLLTVLEVAREMFERGITLLPVDLYQSDATRFIISPSGLVPPLAALQGVGDVAAQHIVEAREQGRFTSIEDLRLRSKVSKAVLDVLGNHGCLQGLDETDQMVLFS